MSLLPFEYAVRNLGRSPLRLILSVGGSVLVVLLVLAAAGFVIGMQSSLNVSGDEDNVILLGAGSEESIERSEIPMRTTGIVGASVAGIRTRAGVDAVSPEIHLALPIVPWGSDDDMTGQLAVIRGFEPSAFLVHDDVIVTGGQLPMPGSNEIAVGRIAAIGMGFDPPESILGESFQLDDEQYEAVGLLAANGGVIEGEFWVPLTDLQVTAQRDSLSCVVVRCESATSEDLDAFVAQRLDLELISMPETDYYAALAAFFKPVQWMVIVTAVLIAMGGVLGGLNTMYAAFASRVREIGSLQTLGYLPCGHHDLAHPGVGAGHFNRGHHCVLNWLVGSGWTCRSIFDGRLRDRHNLGRSCSWTSVRIAAWAHRSHRACVALSRQTNSRGTSLW